jgi:hypothetical protein
MKIKTWNIEAETGYKPMTTFYEDLSIADMFGVKAIKDTYKQVFKEWKHDYKFITEFIMALNWKSWEHMHNQEYCSVYADLYYEARDWAFDNLKGEELQYFIEITD